MGRFVRIGIDVGGTFTKAVMVDDATHAIVGQAVVPTTHTAREGVAAGVIEAFRRVLAGAAVSPGDVVFIAHSTTQATNALLEGDVAAVGVLGMGRGAVESRLARSQTAVGDVELASGRRISAGHVFLRSDALSRDDVRTAVTTLRERGMRVIVASDAFSVDDPAAEQQVMAVARELGLPATGGHEITKLYGLTIRTRTAVINTSTNIAVIRNGRPTIAFAELGGHRTYVSSLDVRVLGVAGGSLVRVQGDRIVDVGPRSAHIAGLPYASFLPAERLADADLVFVQPKPGDPSDYVAVRVDDASRVAITTTDAANALGVIPRGDYAWGSPEAARRALAPLAARVRTSVDEAAQRILDVAVAKVVPTIERLVEEYALERDQMTLVGGGGGASALIPYAAQRLGLDYRIAENAAVISSIGVALAMVQDSVTP